MEKANFVVRIPQELNEKITQIAQKQGQTKNSIVVQALWDISKKYKEVK